tara:strand:+ start:352 stop:528 length:177 start_codon:yes stop_codon:yes gene_type:complete
MKKIRIYTNKEDCWGIAWLQRETATHFTAVADPNYRTFIQFPKNLFYFEDLTDSVNVL